MATMLASKSLGRTAAVSRPKVGRSTKVITAAASAGRPVWLPGSPPPAHLSGKLSADYGFDPLGLGQNAERLKWYVEAEKTNGRWAMAAVAGILGQELLGVPVKWYDAGAQEYSIPNVPLLALEFIIMGFLETKRYIGFKETGTSGFVNSFPFDPVGMNSADMQTKEIKNGRLAMVAFVGFAVQAIATRTTPIQGLQAHLSDPVGKNITYYLTHLPETLGSV